MTKKKKSRGGQHETAGVSPSSSPDDEVGVFLLVPVSDEMAEKIDAAYEENPPRFPAVDERTYEFEGVTYVRDDIDGRWCLPTPDHGDDDEREDVLALAQRRSAGIG